MQTSDSLRQSLARKAAWRVSQAKKTSPSTKRQVRISTFPQRFEVLLDRLVEQAKTSAEFTGLTVDEINDSIEHRLFTLIHEYPFWFSHTPDADDKAHALTRDHDVAHGLRQAAPLTPNQLAALARRKQQRAEREQRIADRASQSMASEAS